MAPTAPDIFKRCGDLLILRIVHSGLSDFRGILHNETFLDDLAVFYDYRTELDDDHFILEVTLVESSKHEAMPITWSFLHVAPMPNVIVGSDGTPFVLQPADGIDVRRVQLKIERFKIE